VSASVARISHPSLPSARPGHLFGHAFRIVSQKRDLVERQAQVSRSSFFACASAASDAASSDGSARCKRDQVGVIQAARVQLERRRCHFQHRWIVAELRIDNSEVV